MSWTLTRFFVTIFLFTCLYSSVQGQQGFAFSCSRDTTIAGCATNPCFTLKSIIPDIRAVSDSYYVNRINAPGACMPVYVNPADPGTSGNIVDDDKYTAIIPIGFPFQFYGATYNNLVVSSNGDISFNISLANQQPNEWQTTNNLPSTDYDEALIMGVYHDIDVEDPANTSPARLIHYTTVGAAPNRKWVLTFYKIPLFYQIGTPPCPGLIENTSQIVLYESTGIIEVLVFSKQICPGWQNGKAMIGIQSFDKLKGQVPPGRGASDPAWGTVNMNEGWRFVPSKGASLLKRVELYDQTGTLVATGTTTDLGNGRLEASFPNICAPANATTTYIVRPVYTKIDDPAVEVFGADTVRVTRSPVTNLNATTVLVPAQCGLNNGQVTVNIPAATGVAPFQYSIDGGALQASNQFTNLAAGSHNVHVQDAGGCSSDLVVNITTSGTMTLAHTAINTTCFGAANGSITVTPPSGVAPITYSINNGPFVTNNVFSGLAAGTYQIRVMDGGTCQGTISNIVITSGPKITMTSMAYPVSCPGSNNGRIIVTGSSGTAPFEYSINGGAYQSSPTFSNLTPATYLLSVRDAVGCISSPPFHSQNVPIGNGTLTGTTTPTGTTCGSLNNGSITVTATAGSGPYEYSIDNGTTWQTSNVFNNLAANTYQVRIRENGTCTSAIISSTVTAGANLTGTATSTAASCTGATNGTVTVTATSGSGPYEYSIDNGTTWQTSNVFNGLAPNTYTAMVRQGGTCSSSGIPVTVAAGSTVTGTTATTATSCNGASNGGITVTATSGTGPYEYSIDNGTTWQASNSFTNLAANTYSVRIRENGLCTSNTINAIVNPGATLTGTVTPTATSCNGASNGSITVNPTSGTGPYQYSIDNGTTWQASNTFTGLAANTYSVRIRENGVCTSNTINATVIAGATLTGTATPTATSCNGASNGSITITPTSGTGPYEYSIDNGATWQASNTFNSLAVNTYSVRIRENGVCTSNIINANVTAGSTLTGTATPTATSCNGASNGSITITPTSGTGPYEYSIDNGATWQASNTFNSLAVNTYSVRIRENGVCTSNIINANVTAGSTLTGTATPTATSCNGASNGSITVTATSGTGPYEYSIDNGATWQTSSSFTNLAANSYSVRIRENGVCTSNTINATVAAGSTLTGTATPTATSCSGANNGSITVTATSGSGPYEYSIDNGATWQASNSFINLAANSYSVRIRENGVCTSNTITTTVTAGATLSGTVVTTATACSGINNGSITVTPGAGFTGPFEYSLDGGAFQTSNIFTGVSVAGHNVVIRNASGCSSQPITATVAAGTAVTGTITSTNTSCSSAIDGSITATPTNGSAPYLYSLDGGANQAGNIFNGITAGSHNIVITDNFGCISAPLPVTVTAGAVLTGTATTTGTACTGVNNGSITVTANAGFTGPFEYSLDAGTFQTSNIFTGIAAGAHNVVIRNAAGCISPLIPAAIATGSVLTSTAASTPTSCSGATNGTITLTPTNGSAPYQYSLDGGANQSSNIFTGVAAGAHNVIVTDAFGCVTAPIPVTVTEGLPLIAVMDIDATSCNGANDGAITVLMNNGNPPIQFSINGGAYQSSNVFSNLAPATYTINYIDALGCTAGAGIPIPVSAGPQLSGTATSTATACSGINNGSITVTANAAFTGPFEYSLDAGAFQTSNNFVNVSAGAHNVTIRNASGCTSANIPVSVAAGSVLIGTATPVNTSCSGAADGSITATASNGSGPYQYSLDGGANQASNIFNNVTAGPHNIVITDNFGCISAAIPVTVTAGSVLNGTTTTTSTACAGVNNGSITVTPGAGFSGPFEYSLDGGAFQTSNIFTGVSAAGHNVVIRNASGCSSQPITATVAAGTAVTGTITSANTSCNGAADGIITATPTNGGAPYLYSLDGGVNQTSNIFTGVAAGPHNIIITDNFGCISPSIPVTVTAGAILNGTVATTSTACAGVNNGSITVTPGAGFSGPFEYSLDGGTFQTSNIFTGVSAAGHNVVIRNTAGCSSQPIAATVAAGTAVTGTITSTNTSCSGAIDGSITATPTNGGAPYLYSLDGGANQAGNTFNGITAGAHNIVITDNFGCISAPLPVTITAGAVLNGTATTTATACVGANNGSITVTPGAGFTGPFQYSLDGVTFQASNNFTAIAAGNYNAVIRNAAGCTSPNIPVTVTAGTSLNGTATFTVVTCNGAADGSITVTPTNGGAPYQYSLNGGGFQAGATFSSLVAGNYNVTIRDAFGCVSAPINITVTEPAALTVPIPVITPAVCNGASNGKITVNPTGGNTPYSYSLDNVNFQPTNIFNVPQGTYTVYVRDAKGCSVQRNNLTVTQPQVLTANIVSTTNSTCNGGSDGTIEITASGGTAPYQYSLNGTNFQTSNILNVASGTYNAIRVRDANNCEFTLPNTTIGLTDNLTLTTVTPAPICEGSSVQLQLNSNGISYTWDAASVGLSSLTVPDPVASPTTTTIYTVTATLGSCTRTGTVTVAVIPAPIPDAGTGGTICFGQDLQLQGSGGATYTWSPATYLDDATISNPLSIKPARTITYTLSVRDANNCPSLTTDQVTVTVTPPIKVNVSPSDTVIYPGDQIRLFASIAGTDTSYTWTPTTGLNNPNISNPVVSGLNVGDVIPYKVTVTTSAGCQGEGFVTVRVYEGPDLYVPTAFTPNKDGKNDVFIPFPVGIKQLNYFSVFNRWGQRIYFTKTLNQGWDGTIAGVEQATGIYIWLAEAVTQDGRVIKKKGTVMLIR